MSSACRVDSSAPSSAAGGVDLAAQVVEAAQQRLAVAEPVEGHALEDHVRHAVGVGLERGVGQAEEARLAGDRPRSRSSSSATGRRTAAPTRRPAPAASTTTEPNDGQPPPGWLCCVPAGHALERRRAAPREPTSERMTANLSIIVGEPRQVLADLDAGDVRGDRLELAADLGRGVRLEVEHVLVRRPAGQEDHDDRLVRAADAGLLPRRGGVAAATARRARATDLQERPSRGCGHGRSRPAKQDDSRLAEKQ